MTEIREQLNTLIQMMQRTNLQPQQGSDLGCHEMLLDKLTKSQMGTMKLTLGTDQEDRIIIFPVVSNLRFNHLEEVVHSRNTWSGFRWLKRRLNGMNIIKKGSARWQHLSLWFTLFYGRKT